MSNHAKAWTILTIGGLLQILWAAMVNRADGFTHLEWLISGLAVSLVTVIMLGWAMRLIAVGTGYAAWIGLGAVGTVIVGIVVFNESTDPLRLFLIACIITGIVGLRFTDRPDQLDEEPSEQVEGRDGAVPRPAAAHGEAQGALAPTDGPRDHGGAPAPG